MTSACDHRHAHSSTDGNGIVSLDCRCGYRGVVRPRPAASVRYEPDKRSAGNFVRQRCHLPLCQDCKTVRVSRRTFQRCTECSHRRQSVERSQEVAAGRRAQRPLCIDCGLVHVIRVNVSRCSDCAKKHHRRNKYVRKTNRPYVRKAA